MEGASGNAELDQKQKDRKNSINKEIEKKRKEIEDKNEQAEKKKNVLDEIAKAKK